MTHTEAAVTPQQPWNDGPAIVVPLPDGYTQVVPMYNYTKSSVTVDRRTFPVGHVAIPKAKPPTGNWAVLPLIETNQLSVQVTDLGLKGSPNEHGVVVLFI